MSSRLRLIPRIALFSALIYVLSWGMSYLPNVNLIFFIVFLAGLMWGIGPGLLVGAIGMGLWTALNPFGPATPPVMVAQIAGTALSGLVGALFQRWGYMRLTGRRLTYALIVGALLCTLLFYLPVNFIDAWVFKPFWPRFVAGMIWSSISLVTNMIIFPLLFRPARFVYNKERVT